MQNILVLMKNSPNCGPICFVCQHRQATSWTYFEEFQVLSKNAASLGRNQCQSPGAPALIGVPTR